MSIYRKVGKRKAAAKPDNAGKRQAKKGKAAKKDPNKPKRPPSAFFVFLYVLILLSPVSLFWLVQNISNCLIAILIYFGFLILVRSLGRHSRKKILM